MRILSAAPGFIAPLTEDEINKFLTESKLPIHISTSMGKENQTFIRHRITLIALITDFIF